jgi:alkylation response protein AidB-like acyl-CoA dehydrogenase
MISIARATRWLEPVWPAAAELSAPDLVRIGDFEDTLTGLLSAYPVGRGVDAATRSQRLRMIRRDLAAGGFLSLAVPARDGGRGHPPILQALLQFTCGYHDVDLRDCTGLGHGRLIADHAAPQVRDRWLPQLLAGAVPGIAITESHGGSQVQGTRTGARPGPGGTWQVTGVKTWISRLTEAAVFCAFFTSPAGELTAAVIDASAPGLDRRPLIPSGLSGWTWGELHLQDVTIRPCDILGEPGAGIRLLREHFARYRPLVTATALGAAAAAHDDVAAQLNSRHRAGTIARIRDNAYITLGRTFAQMNAALLATITASQLAEACHPSAPRWGCAVKAHGIDVAHQAVAELALLAGASAFVEDSRLAKAHADLNALLYADGIHDSLYRSAGRDLTTLASSRGWDIPRQQESSKEVLAPPLPVHAASSPATQS